MDYEYKFENGFKFKANAQAYYDAIYDIKGSEKFSQDELDELRSEVELFDAYIEGKITDNFDIKLAMCFAALDIAMFTCFRRL